MPRTKISVIRIKVMASTSSPTTSNSNIVELEQPLHFDTSQLSKYEFIRHVDKSNIDEYFMNLSSDQKHTVLNVAIRALESKQCNEQYESMISSCLGLVNSEHKHGLDAWNENKTDFYEHKPCDVSVDGGNPSGSINDDTIEKMDHYQYLVNQKKNVWVTLAGVNKRTYTLDSIYKFPSEIYDKDRRDYLDKTIKKNKNNENSNQTRSTYSISVPKSIQLCKDSGKVYYAWKRYNKPLKDLYKDYREKDVEAELKAELDSGNASDERINEIKNKNNTINKPLIKSIIKKEWDNMGTAEKCAFERQINSSFK